MTTTTQNTQTKNTQTKKPTEAEQMMQLVIDVVMDHSDELRELQIEQKKLSREFLEFRNKFVELSKLS